MNAEEQLRWKDCSDEQLAAVAGTDAAAMYALVQRYSRWIRWRAAELRGVLEAEDLVQEGFLGLLAAVDSFQESRQVRFSTYASVCIRNRMRSALRENRRNPLPVGDAASVLFETEDVTARPDHVAVQHEEWEHLLELLVRRLSRQEYQVCVMYLGGRSYASIAEKLSISPKAVDNTLQRIRRKLRQIQKDRG